MEFCLDLPQALQRNQRKLVDFLLLRTGPERRSISRPEIASLLGISLDIVGLLLASLQAKGAVLIERNRLIIRKQAMENLAAQPVMVRAYGLLKTKNGATERAYTIMRCQNGVIMTDWVEGDADVIFAIQASDRESLAQLVVQAIAAVEPITDDIQLLPAR